jgi:penicillin-binding protein 1A
LAAIAPLVLGEEWKKLSTVLLTRLHQYRRSNEYPIPKAVLNSLIAAEDHRFAKHSGVDLIALVRAIWRLVSVSKIEGASSIEQQLVRTLTGRYERRLSRKLREIMLATLVSTTFPKAEIPALYLLIAYFGWHMNGYAAACRRLGIQPKNVGLEEAAKLIARLKYPQPKHCSLERTKKTASRAQHIVWLASGRELVAAADGTGGTEVGHVFPAVPDLL